MNKYLTIFTSFCFVLISHSSLMAMDNHEIVHICSSIEMIEGLTPSFSEEERSKITQIISIIKYSNSSIISDEDIEKFDRNVRRICDGSDDDRRNDLQYLVFNLNEDDVIDLNLRNTLGDIYYKSNSYFEKIKPLLALATAELNLYQALNHAWHRGEDGHELITIMLRLPLCFYMLHFPRDRLDVLLSQIGFMSCVPTQVLQPLRFFYYDLYEKLPSLF